MTSVKDFEVETEPTRENLGAGRFLFSDRYSVFDWGEMPDSIPGKGSSLCTMGAFNFELLEKQGVSTHYRGLFEEDDEDETELYRSNTPVTAMEIELTQVPELPFRNGTYDYEQFHKEGGKNYLIPLEIVFRNRVPTGSSLRRRTEPSDHELPFEEWPEEAVVLNDPIVEFSTKYEEQDRYLDRKEANKIAGQADLNDLEQLARRVNTLITNQAVENELIHEDGKIECMYHKGDLKVADVVGTLDENRFTYSGETLSKEFLRQYYRNQQPEWVKSVKDAKMEARSEGLKDWQSLCNTEPDPLLDDIVEIASQLYCSATNTYTRKNFFDTTSLDTVVDRIKKL